MDQRAVFWEAAKTLAWQPDHLMKKSASSPLALMVSIETDFHDGTLLRLKDPSGKLLAFKTFLDVLQGDRVLRYGAYGSQKASRLGNIHPVGGEMDRLPDSHLLALFQGKVEDSLGIHDESHAFRRHSEGTENRPENHGKKYDSHGKEPHPADGSCNGKHGVQLLRGTHLVQGFLAEYLPALFVPLFSDTL
ncbi:MAG: hypothetical protein IJT01_11815 [Selenomonadaceae bacterium]|nr:hypothetical protein [Selenomonadaceae bacterium]